jgi:hypothetical protein
MEGTGVQQFWLIQFENPHGCVDQVADTTSRRLHAAGPQLKVGLPIVISDPIFVVHFLKGFQRSAKPFRHHLGMLSDVAVLVGVRMGWFEDKNVPKLQDPASPFAERRKRSLQP